LKISGNSATAQLLPAAVSNNLGSVPQPVVLGAMMAMKQTGGLGGLPINLKIVK